MPLPLPPLLPAEVFSRTVTGSNLGDKNPHDFPSMDLNLGKHFVMCKLFLNRTERFRSAIQDLVCWESPPKIDVLPRNTCPGRKASPHQTPWSDREGGKSRWWSSLGKPFFFNPP